MHDRIESFLDNHHIAFSRVCAVLIVVFAWKTTVITGLFLGAALWVWPKNMFSDVGYANPRLRWKINFAIAYLLFFAGLAIVFPWESLFLVLFHQAYRFVTLRGRENEEFSTIS